MLIKDTDLIVILGPTATGKTRLAARLAFLLGGEVISADSRQVYRGMDIGSGKDLDDYMVEDHHVPYHLIDIRDPGEEYSLYDFLQDFQRVYSDIRGRGNAPLLCGGTGMFIEAVLKGYQLPEAPLDPEYRTFLDRLEMTELKQMLERFRPLHNDTDTDSRSRIYRALEIEKARAEGRMLPVTEIKHPVVFGISMDRDLQKKSITARLQSRLNNGMTEEVAGLLEKGISPTRLIRYGLEYRYITSFLIGEISRDVMFNQLNTAIHQFSKRQMTWFRRMERKGIKIHWMDAGMDLSEKINYIFDVLNLIR